MTGTDAQGALDVSNDVISLASGSASPVASQSPAVDSADGRATSLEPPVDGIRGSGPATVGVRRTRSDRDDASAEPKRVRVMSPQLVQEGQSPHVHVMIVAASQRPAQRIEDW